MPTIQLIADPREPGKYQVFATGVDASLIAIGGSIQATWWISTGDAAKLHRDLSERLNTEGPQPEE
jgi:hypothetical protein